MLRDSDDESNECCGLSFLSAFVFFGLECMSTESTEVYAETHVCCTNSPLCSPIYTKSTIITWVLCIHNATQCSVTMKADRGLRDVHFNRQRAKIDNLNKRIVTLDRVLRSGNVIGSFCRYFFPVVDAMCDVEKCCF
jgi:hypothetical protein